MNTLGSNITPTPGWQITIVVFDLILFGCFLFLLVKKFRSKKPYTHFEGKLYWVSIILLLANLVFYMYGRV